jgi:regulator of RNase E activity RraA
MISHALKALRHITTGTITVLLKKDIRRCWMNGPKPLHAAGRNVGSAFTLRFVPAREDLATPESRAKPVSTCGAIAEMPEGCIAVADTIGATTAGIFGDILTMRMVRRSVAPLLTDGAVRDREGARQAAASQVCRRCRASLRQRPHFRRLAGADRLWGAAPSFWPTSSWRTMMARRFVPQNLLEFVAAEGAEHELMETFIAGELKKAARLPGLYPMNEETRACYAAWKDEK